MVVPASVSGPEMVVSVVDSATVASGPLTRLMSTFGAACPGRYGSVTVLKLMLLVLSVTVVVLP